MSWVRTFCSCFSSLVYPLYSTPRLDSLQTRSPYFSLSTPRGASSFFRRQKTRRKELAVPGRRISTTPATIIFTPSPAHSLEHCVQDTLFSRDTPGSACSFLLLAQAPVSFTHPGSTIAFLFFRFASAHERVIRQATFFRLFDDGKKGRRSRFLKFSSVFF